jgi:hypothetical protein
VNSTLPGESVRGFVSNGLLGIEWQACRPRNEKGGPPARPAFRTGTVILEYQRRRDRIARLGITVDEFLGTITAELRQTQYP